MSEQEKNQLIFLLQRYADDLSTPGELKKLSELLQQNQYDESLTQLLTAMAAQTAPAQIYDNDAVDSMIMRILNKKEINKPELPRIHPVRKTKWWWAAAAVIILLGIAARFFLVDNKQSGVERTVAADIKAPEKNRAMITLANGNRVYLDSAANGELAKQGNISLVKSDNGKIAYKAITTDDAKETVYNTLVNPRGSKVIDMTLTEGSHVWLNAGSSVTYPLTFTGNERKVNVTGEVYFEVVHDATRPFKVSKDNLEITVLGTHFNVNAYDDEQHNKVTLIEGSVKASIHGSESVILKPGQQAEISGSRLTRHDDVNLEAVMAWKNGWFDFNNLRVEDIMRELSRWYDVEVEYTTQPTQKHFSGILSRNSNITEVLKIMEKANIHFTIEGRKIKVMQ
ncbi:MAG: FecR domain-containing protein [Agriterribacter sp.]